MERRSVDDFSREIIKKEANIAVETETVSKCHEHGNILEFDEGETRFIKPEPRESFAEEIEWNETIFVCAKCELAFTVNSSLERHLNTVHPEEGSFVCDDCGQAFGRKSHLVRHLKRRIGEHSAANIFRSEQCGGVFADAPAITKHLATEHEDFSIIKEEEVDRFECNECDSEFADAGALKRHSEIHEKLKKYVCVECGRSFVAMLNLKEHLEEAHPQARKFACEERCTGYNQASSSQSHIINPHSEERRFACEKCSDAFTQADSLQRHVKNEHSEERKYTGDKCYLYVQTQADILKSNTRKAYLEDPKNTCYKCNVVFTQAASFKRHIKNAHSDSNPNNRCVCPDCGKSVRVGAGFKRHVRLFHSKFKVFKCTECDRSFGWKAHLNKHLYSVHQRIKE